MAKGETLMRGISTATLRIVALLGIILPLLANRAVAQEVQQVSFKTPSGNSKFTQQITITVGDVPNHVVRAFEVHRTYPTNPPLIAGLKLVEQIDRGLADIIAGNGSGSIYGEYVLENGDKLLTDAIRQLNEVLESSPRSTLDS
jgi:hypothetical protein